MAHHIPMAKAYATKQTWESQGKKWQCPKAYGQSPSQVASQGNKGKAPSQGQTPKAIRLKH